MGLVLFGGGTMTLLSGTQIGFAEGLRAGAAGARCTSGCCLASLGAVGLFISTLTEQPIGADDRGASSSAPPASSWTPSRR